MAIISKTAAQWEAAKTTVLSYGDTGYETDTYKRKIGDGVTQYQNLTYEKLIRPRRAIKAQWEAKDPVIGKDEIVVESDTKRMKFGDGTTAYSSLPYADVYVTGLIGALASLSTSAKTTIVAAINELYNKFVGVVRKIKLNGQTYSPDSTGLVDLGTIEGGGGTGGSVSLDTTMPEVPTDTKAPSTKLMADEHAKLWNKVGNTMTIDQKVTYDKISSGIYGIGVTALGSGTIKINNVNRDLSAGYNELLIDGIFAIESLASDKNILSIDWITTNADITRLAFNGAELLNRLNISFCVFNSVNMQINAKSLTEINFDTCIFKGISSLRFSTCDSLYSAKINAKIKVNTLQNFFMGRNYLLKDLCISNFDTSDCTSFQYAFFRLDKLERLDLSGIDTSKVNHYGSAFDGSNMQLKDFLAPKPNTCKATVSFGQCPNLTVGATYSKPSVDSIIDWLYDYVAKGETTTNTITFHSTVKNALSQTQTDAITNKGWTIA